jgi:glutathione peroxidase
MNDKLLELELESLKDGLLFSGRFCNKPVVIFNSASQCGFTKQFADFQQLYEGGKIIPIALPTNEFNNQEPGDNYELLQFCKTHYDVNFPVCKKTDLNHVMFQRFGRPDWNFNKYLLDKNHNFVKQFDAYFNPKELLNYV